jgi:bifunctional DNA-binding transcriptional regulator/antitoxin component of YhaV-PrlF toxin-antitoxin module
MGQYTYYVTIPAKDIDELGWREKQRIVVERDGQVVTVRDWKKKTKK